MTNQLSRRLRRIPKHTILLVGVILFVFIFPLFESGSMKEFLITFSYTIMILSVSSIVEFKSKWVLYLIIFAVLFQWATFIKEGQELFFIDYITFSFSLIVFSIATYKMIHQIIKSKKVNAQLIIQTITGYLLIGVIFTLVTVLQLSYNQQAIGFSNDTTTLGDIIYYCFVTFTTIGYGDISPITQSARGFAILFGLIGQLYLTIIIAFIIGKYLNSKN